MIWMAPLHGISYYHFRNCFFKHFHGISCAISPFIAAQPKDRINPKKIPDLFPEHNTLLPVIPQLMGNRPNDIRETALVLHDTFGYERFNWNIGCPVNQIVRKKRGCGIMPMPDLVENTVNEVCGKTTLRFSLKMRLGLQAQEEGLEILQRVAPYPIDFLCIHPRLGTQQYEGSVDLNAFELFYKTTNHQIVYSGDINNVDFFVYLQKRFPKIEHWMLGRGILKHPFLAEQIKNLIPFNVSNNCRAQKNRFINFYNEYTEMLNTLKAGKNVLSACKELWHFFAVFWELDTVELQKLLQLKDYIFFHKAVNNLFCK